MWWDRGRNVWPVRKATVRPAPPADPARSRSVHGSACAALLDVWPWVTLSKARNYYLNRPAFAIRHKRLPRDCQEIAKRLTSARMRPLKCAGAVDTVAVRSGNSREIPRKTSRESRGDSNDQAGLRARAHDLQNLFRFGLARGRAARRVPRQRRRCP